MRNWFEFCGEELILGVALGLALAGFGAHTASLRNESGSVARYAPSSVPEGPVWEIVPARHWASGMMVTGWSVCWHGLRSGDGRCFDVEFSWTRLMRAQPD
jgi:hypothetical protein